PAIKRLGNKLIVLTGAKRSLLAGNSDCLLDISVPREACSLGLVPTASTTAALALGDALAVTIFEKRGFKKEDFALFHPGGNLGRRLMSVGELMHKGADLPKVSPDASMREVILEMTAKRLGVTAVVDKRGVVSGVITDGDLRRLLAKEKKPLELKAAMAMTRHPQTIGSSEIAEQALKKMEDLSITSLLVVDGRKKLVGLIHLHDLLKAGVV
ncbi:arabinose-5-phosphate isomerase, partial [sediment metagenome]